MIVRIRRPRRLCRLAKKQRIPKHYVYKGLLGSIEYSMNDKCFHGKILNIKSSISYESENLKYLEYQFQEAVNDYIEISKEIGAYNDR